MENEEKRIETRKQSVIPFSAAGAASALYASLYTFCLYRNASGITYPFFVAGTLCYFGFCIKKYRSSCEKAVGTSGKVTIIFYAVSIFLLGISVCLTDDFKVLWMTKTGIFLLTILFVLRSMYETKEWNFFQYLSAMGHCLMETLQCMDTPFADAWEFFGKKDERRRDGKIRYILIGLAAGLPLMLVVLALLLSADAVFRDLFDRLIGKPDLRDAFLICLLVAAVYVISYSYVRGLTTYGIPKQKPIGKKGEPVAAITFTFLIAVIYLIFCVIQMVYLFGKNMQLPEGLTWAAYARQGFFQLLFVCLINLAVVLFCIALFGESRILKGILTAISLMTYIMMASSAYRMLLYIQAYYLTFLRLFVLWALAVIAVVFGGVIFAIYHKSFPLFGYCTVVVTCLYLAFAFAKPDCLVARYDIAHVQSQMTNETEVKRNGYQDQRYLSSLSADAAPILLGDDAQSVWGDTNAYDTYCEKIKERTREMGLRNFNFSRWRAKKSLG